MASQTLYLVLITAILACPMRCGSGVCHEYGGLATEQHRQETSSHQLTKCCCCQRASQSSPDNDSGGPAPVDDSPCQGVCGGAVFEKPVELSERADLFALPLHAADDVDSCRPAEFGPHPIHGDHFVIARANHGRFLRTLHMSFLC